MINTSFAAQAQLAGNLDGCSGKWIRAPLYAIGTFTAQLTLLELRISVGGRSGNDEGTKEAEDDEELHFDLSVLVATELDDRVSIKHVI